jgi:hypothetical protein
MTAPIPSVTSFGCAISPSIILHFIDIIKEYIQYYIRLDKSIGLVETILFSDNPVKALIQPSLIE